MAYHFLYDDNGSLKCAYEANEHNTIWKKALATIKTKAIADY